MKITLKEFLKTFNVADLKAFLICPAKIGDWETEELIDAFLDELEIRIPSNEFLNFMEGEM